MYMIHSGFTTDGEWNSLRTKGNTRPLSVLQIRSDVRRKYARLTSKKLHGMITVMRKSHRVHVEYYISIDC